MTQLLPRFVCGLACLVLATGTAFAQDDDIFGSLPSRQNPSPQEDDGEGGTDEFSTIPRRDTGAQQSVEVNEDRGGWNEAGQGISRNRLSKDLRANWVMVDSNGLLLGTAIGFDGAAAADVQVHLLRKGIIVDSTFVNENGQFSFNNVQQGTYGLIGIGQESFFGFGFNAIRNTDNPRAEAPRSITVMAAPNQTSINTDWISFFGPEVNYRVIGRFQSRQGTDDAPRLYGNDGISIHYPKAFPATSVQSHAVTTLSDGRLIGRVHHIDSETGRPADLRNTRVILLQNDDVFAATSTDNFGVFDFTQIPTGNYSLVAAGNDGMAAIGIEVVEPDNDLPFEVDDEDESEDEKVYPIDLALIPTEATGWLVAEANEFSYKRAIARTARLNASRSGCNCPPQDPQATQTILDALRPSDRGRFWRRFNEISDRVFSGEDVGATQGQQPGFQQQQQFQQQFQPQFQQQFQPQFQQQFQPQFQQPVLQQPFVQQQQQFLPPTTAPQSSLSSQPLLSAPLNPNPLSAPSNIPSVELIPSPVSPSVNLGT